ncbi:hypothetical protein PC129_g21084 [Phytophthora cactorum]|uniref:Uncharacterized protein n=1 Tax=Phytophthora cactorum TaxID=29920 RepID=A0A329S969_9STRA|nr:hypothetical protein Pcac1_g12700 [Phytophthora cactorum]KAG2797492.1 hypothetical protein PC112_g21752 [Phytophthora cactorum]KAG2911687.1 hypothetical protein PC114_g9286 [Phytophthora cactorum]KAG2944567.1 hypothetical protein PC117_g9020 [Phytophthora cactorum]KAG2990203.1 hypothetical protein PC118_g5766 [Phytophthora cactorum]
MEQWLGNEGKRAREVDRPMTPPMHSSRFASRLGSDARMHLNSLAGSPSRPRTTPPRRPTAAPQYIRQKQPGYEMPMSELQRLYAAAQGHGPVGPPPQLQAAYPQPGAAGVRTRIRTSGKSGIRMHDKRSWR